jgi:hypothetical protein
MDVLMNCYLCEDKPPSIHNVDRQNSRCECYQVGRAFMISQDENRRPHGGDHARFIAPYIDEILAEYEKEYKRLKK